MNDEKNSPEKKEGLSRRSFLARSAASLAGLSLAPSALMAKPAPQEKEKPKMEKSIPGKNPNLVFVFADQLRTMSQGYAGDKKAYTPNIDRLAGESVDFRNAVSGYPMCAPMRASLFTGKYPSSTGMVINELRVMPDPDAFGHVLENHGYHTGYIGKWHLFGKNHSLPQQFCPPGPYRLGFDGEWAAFNFNHHYYKGFYFRDKFEKIDIDGFEPHEQTNMAIDFMKKSGEADKPFALFLSFGVPHDPWHWDNCPETFNQLFRETPFPNPPNYQDGQARYWNKNFDEKWFITKWKPHLEQFRQVYHAQVASLDWNIGRLVKALKDMNLEENTIFVFSSDHGEMFGAHGRIQKKIFYDEAVRIPFLVRWPGHLQSRVVDACLDVPDMMPTLLTLMGVPVPDSVEGMDLSHVTLGRPGPEPEAAFMQGMGHTYQWVNGDEWRALRDKQFTYAVMRADKSEYLFDNLADPYQQRNLVSDPSYAATLKHFREMLKKRMAALNDTFESTTWYRDHWIEDRVIVRSATRELEAKYRPENIPLPHIKES